MIPDIERVLHLDGLLVIPDIERVLHLYLCQLRPSETPCMCSMVLRLSSHSPIATFALLSSLSPGETTSAAVEKAQSQVCHSAVVAKWDRTTASHKLHLRSKGKSALQCIAILLTISTWH